MLQEQTNGATAMTTYKSRLCGKTTYEPEFTAGKTKTVAVFHPAVEEGAMAMNAIGRTPVLTLFALVDGLRLPIRRRAVLGALAAHSTCPLRGPA